MPSTTYHHHDYCRGSIRVPFMASRLGMQAWAEEAIHRQASACWDVGFGCGNKPRTDPSWDELKKIQRTGGSDWDVPCPPITMVRYLTARACSRREEKDRDQGETLHYCKPICSFRHSSSSRRREADGLRWDSVDYRCIACFEWASEPFSIARRPAVSFSFLIVLLSPWRGESEIWAVSKLSLKTIWWKYADPSR